MRKAGAAGIMAPAPGCKVDSVAATYGLDAVDPVYDSIDRGLLARWTGVDGRQAMGYRSLTEWFNKRLLKSVYDTHGRESLDTRLDSDCEALRSDDALVRDELVKSLRVDGIPGEELRQDMVSWGTMRAHLLECLDGEKAAETATTDWERKSVDRAKEVTKDKAKSALSALSQKSDVRGGDAASVDVQVQLSCDTCPTRVSFTVALEQGYVCEQHSD